MSAVQLDLEDWTRVGPERQELPRGLRASERARRVDIRRQTDGDVVRFAAKGDDAAWSELINRFGGLVNGIARRTGLGESDAGDAAQLTWMRLWQNLDKLRDPDHVAGWLATTARRESIRVAVGLSRNVLSADPTEQDDSLAPSHPGADCQFLDQQYDSIIETAMERLPSQYRVLLELLASDACFTYAEVARSLGVPVGSVGPMRLRGLDLLRRAPEVAALQHPRACATTGLDCTGGLEAFGLL